MFNVQPPNLIDGLFSPPQAAQNTPTLLPSQPDGGYNWGNRSFNPGPGQPGHHFVPGGFNPAQPIQKGFIPDLRRAPVVGAQNPVPGHAPTLAQMRQMMTQLHVQQMLNRMQKHSNYHAGG